MSIASNLSQYSWVRYCKLESAETLSGIDLLNPKVVSWFNTFVEPDLADRTGDIQYMIVTGDRLDKLSLQFYGTPFLWWVIAAKNSLDLPSVELYSGVKIIIPDPAYVTTQLIGKKVTVSK